MEISVYDVHHIVAKYLNLRQHVYMVSDWLVFFCSFLCCQCGEYMDMPVDGLSEASSVMYQITPKKLEVNSVQSDEELFTSPLGNATESPVNILKSTELWSLVDKPRKLDGKVELGNHFEPSLMLTDSLPVEILPHTTSRHNDYPTVHSHKRAQEQNQMSEEETK